MAFEIVNQLSQVLYDDIINVSFSVCIQSYLFLLSSDYERSEWRESIQKLQKKGKITVNTVFLKIFFLKNVYIVLKWLKPFARRPPVLRFKFCRAAGPDQLLFQASNCPQHSCYQQ